MTAVFTVQHSFDAPRESVFRAWTTPELFAVWFGGEQVRVPVESVTMDAREGGRWTATMHLPDGNTIDWTGEFTELSPPDRLALTMSDRPDEYAGVPIVVTLAPTEAGGTQLTLKQDRGDFSDEQVEMTIGGYNAFFDAMETVV